MVTILAKEEHISMMYMPPIDENSEGKQIFTKRPIKPNEFDHRGQYEDFTPGPPSRG
jgi:hypothetical protein